MTMRRHLFGSALSLSGAFALGVGLAAAPFAQSAVAQDRPTIAFVAPDLDITQFFGQFYSEVTLTLEEAGLEYDRTEAAPPGGSIG